MSGPRRCSPPTEDNVPDDLLPSTKQTGCPSSPSICEELNLPSPLGARFSPFCGDGENGGFCASPANGVRCCSVCNNVPDNPCPELTCYEYNVDYEDGEELRFVESAVPNRGACESLCRKTTGCTHYVYFTSHYLPYHLRGSCALRRFRRPPAKRVYIEGADKEGFRYGNTHLLTTFAPLDCDYPTTTTTTSTVGATGPPRKPPSCLKNNVDYWGFDLASLRNCPNVNICQEFCQELDGCVGFTFVESQTRCYLKWNISVEVEIEGHSSAPRCCPPPDGNPPNVAAQEGQAEQRTTDTTHAGVQDPLCPAPSGRNCVYPGMDFYGNDIRNHDSVTTAYKCYVLCKEMEDCNVWTHLPAKKLCFLKKAKLEYGASVTEARLTVLREAVADGGAITGFGHCEPFDETAVNELLVHAAVHQENVEDLTKSTGTAASAERRLSYASVTEDNRKLASSVTTATEQRAVL